METVYLNSEDRLTLDDILKRMPVATELILGNDSAKIGTDEEWWLEATPSLESIERDEKWPWLSGQAWYGPTTQAVIDQADIALRKVRR